jgi:hypothetical protein
VRAGVPPRASRPRLIVGEHVAYDAEAKVDELHRHHRPPLRFAHCIMPPDPRMASACRRHANIRVADPPDESEAIPYDQHVGGTARLRFGRDEIMRDAREASRVRKVATARFVRLVWQAT